MSPSASRMISSLMGASRARGAAACVKTMRASARPQPCSLYTTSPFSTSPFSTSPFSTSPFSTSSTGAKSTAFRTALSAGRPRGIPMAAPAAHFHASATLKDDDKAAHKKPETRPCWKCSTPVPYMAFLCTSPGCKAVQTLAPGANYYEVLGLSPEPTFDIDPKTLRNKFLRIQQQIHPDSYSHNINGDQVYAQQQSSLANKAYSTLKEPLSRAKYMLELLDMPIHESESLDEPELLMEVMEARELLEEAQTEEEVQDLKSVNDGRIQGAVEGLSKAFRERDLESAKTLAIELQYWIRIKNVIRDWAAGKPIVADHV